MHGSILKGRPIELMTIMMGLIPRNDRRGVGEEHPRIDLKDFLNGDDFSATFRARQPLSW